MDQFYRAGRLRQRLGIVFATSRLEMGRGMQKHITNCSRVNEGKNYDTRC